MGDGAMRRKGRNEGGYSLIELVVSILMFALGFIGVMKMQQQAIMGNGFSMEMSNALNIADTQSEYLRGITLTETEMTLGTHNAASSQTRQGIAYSLSWTVNTTSLGGTVTARQVAIRVDWTEKGTPHHITMNMFRST
jgi:Tfp pilus assembly protein PilV